jgi:signal transduction histidine kinase
MMTGRTLRTRLTLLYAVPFLITGAALLTFPLLGTRQTVPAPGQGGAPHPAPGDQQGAVEHRVLVASAIALCVMGVVALVLGWLVAGRFLRPLRTIIATARDISASNLHRRLGPTGRDDEFRELAATLDDLFARLQASFESQRHFVANASHELRTPLTAERTLLQVALADPHATADQLRATCQEVLALGRQQERLIDALLTLATGEQGVELHEPFDLADIARDVLATRRREGIQVDAALAPAPAAGDPHLVTILVANLVDNAQRHNTPDGRIEVVTAAAADRSSIAVRNTGPVVPPEELDRLFQPFQQLAGQRTRHTAGHGLGLTIVQAVARAHSAVLTACPRPEGGLDIEVSFPRSSRRAG